VPATAAYLPERGLTVVDGKGDAPSALDVRRVVVRHTTDTFTVVVHVQRYVGMDSGARIGTAVGVHFKTEANRKPDHLIRIEGMHTAAGSTTDWNQLRPNGLDPWGDWLDCFPEGWSKPLIRVNAAKDKLIFKAPIACLEEPESVRVAVQSYKPFRSEVTPDWVIGVRSYLPKVVLTATP
jgi:hypothetical protein